MTRFTKAISIGFLGAGLAFASLTTEHYANTRETPKEMYAIDKATWWLIIPSAPGYCMTTWTTPRDFMFDDEWTTYKWRIIGWNFSAYFLAAITFSAIKRKKTPNQAPQTTIMAVTPAASHPSRQP